MIPKPPLGPVPRTIVTARTISRLDRAAAAVLHWCWWFINGSLQFVVRLVLALEQPYRVAVFPQWEGPLRRFERGWCGSVFVCPWCRCKTPEGHRWALSCCRMAFDEWQRTYAPQAYAEQQALRAWEWKRKSA